MFGSHRLKKVVASAAEKSYAAENVVQEVDDEVINVESSLNQAKVGTFAASFAHLSGALPAAAAGVQTLMTFVLPHTPPFRNILKS